MRALIASLVLVAACTVDDKQPATSDGGAGSDAPDPTGGPDTTITSAPGEFSNAETATFEFESNYPDAQFMCSVDGATPEACTSPFSRSLADGTHTFSVRAINGGQGDDSPAEHVWSIDTVAPITTLTEAPAAADNSTMVRFSFMANEMNVTFECRLDNADFASCRSGEEFGPVGDGAHSFAVRSIDRAGNADASPAVHTWSVDTSTPDTTLLSGPQGQVASSTATFTFVSPDAGPGATFECSLDGSAFAACASPVTYSDLEMGTHTFSVRVRDANNNLDPTPATRTWVADITAPDTTITSAPSGVVSMASAIIAFTSNEADVTYTCSLDGAAMQTCTSPFNVTGLDQGAHTFAVVASDSAGNTDASPATASWTVDTTTPDVMVTSGPTTGATVGPYASFAFTANEGTVECRVDGGEWMACTSPFSFSHAAGAASFEVRAIDGASNETTVTRSFTVACAAPDSSGAAGLLHLEDGGQTLANAAGGATAVLGSTADVESSDPAFTTGRFGMGLELTPGEQDIVTWPVMLGTTSALTAELWVLAPALAGTRDIIATPDGRFSLRVTNASASTVQFSATVVDGSGTMHTATSTAYSAGAWHLVAIALSNTTLSLYVDGDRVQATLPRTDLVVDTLRVGGTFGGSVDEIWVATADYSMALERYCPVSGVRIR